MLDWKPVSGYSGDLNEVVICIMLHLVRYNVWVRTAMKWFGTGSNSRLTDHRNEPSGITEVDNLLTNSATIIFSRRWQCSSDACTDQSARGQTQKKNHFHSRKNLIFLKELNQSRNMPSRPRHRKYVCLPLFHKKNPFSLHYYDF